MNELHKAIAQRTEPSSMVGISVEVSCSETLRNVIETGVKVSQQAGVKTRNCHQSDDPYRTWWQSL